MTRVCVIGNSHAACFKLAWDTLRIRYPNVALTFFAARGSRIAALKPRDGILIPTSERLRGVIAHTSGGRAAIDLRDYDAVLLVGLTCGYPVATGYYSYAAACQALLDLTPKTLAFDLIEKIRKVSDITIFLAHQPLLRHLGDPECEGDLGPYRRLIKFLNDELMQGVGATLLRQPAQTITNYFFTRPEFAVGSTRLDIGDKWSKVEQRENQRAHMNKRYGDIFLSTHLPTIAY